jgi:hypothetical protein
MILDPGRKKQQATATGRLAPCEEDSECLPDGAGGIMGVCYFRLTDRTVPIRIGSREFRAGVLRRIGKAGEDSYVEAASSPDNGPSRPVPFAITEYGSEGLVLGWEAGLKMTNDFDWSLLPRIGSTRIVGGERVVHAGQGPDTRPMTDEDAVRLGVVSADGEPAVFRRPRIVSAILDRRSYEKAVGSAGAIMEKADSVELLMEDGQTVPLYLGGALKHDQLPVVPSALVGMNQDEAWEWLRSRLLRSTEDLRLEGTTMTALPKGHLVFPGASSLTIVAERYRHAETYGLLPSRGAGYPQHPEEGLLAASMLLSRNPVAGSVQGFLAIRFPFPRCPDRILVLGEKDGRLALAFGAASILSEAASRDFPDSRQSALELFDRVLEAAEHAVVSDAGLEAELLGDAALVVRAMGTAMRLGQESPEVDGILTAWSGRKSRPGR